jgi:hypothetical protein
MSDVELKSIAVNVPAPGLMVNEVLPLAVTAEPTAETKTIG